MTTEAENLIRMDGVSVRYGTAVALDSVSLTVAERQIVTVIGPNGAGKSTLLKAALGLVPITAGHIHRRPGLVVGYVPQRLHVDSTFPLSVQRFLSMGARTPHKTTLETLEQVGATPVLTRSLHALSGGELQRVMLARALLRKPHLLALDEPVGGVDLAGQIDLYALIARLAAERNCGVLLISHDLHVVMAATDKVLCLNGHVCCEGHPETVRAHPDYLALFGPRFDPTAPPPKAEALTLYAHTHDHRHDHHHDS